MNGSSTGVLGPAPRSDGLVPKKQGLIFYSSPPPPPLARKIQPPKKIGNKVEFYNKRRGRGFMQLNIFWPFISPPPQSPLVWEVKFLEKKD